MKYVNYNKPGAGFWTDIQKWFKVIKLDSRFKILQAIFNNTIKVKNLLASNQPKQIHQIQKSQY